MSTDADLMDAVVAGRVSGDTERRSAAELAWKTLVGRRLGDVRGLVASFRFPGHPEVRVAPEERDDVVQAALERCLGPLAQTFRGTSAPEFRAAVATCVRFACMDFCRRRLRWERRLAGSLDEPALSADPRGDGAGEPGGRFDRETGAMSARLHEDGSEAKLRLAAIATALHALPNENMRAVIALSGEGYSSAEVAERLRLTTANVDQLRSRGFRRLSAALDEHADGPVSRPAGRRRRRRSGDPRGRARHSAPAARP